MQTPWFGCNDVQDRVEQEEIPLAADMRVLAADHQARMPGAELDRAVGPAPSTREPPSTGSGATAHMSAVNSQNRWAPSARSAISRIPSATTTYRTVVAISQGGHSCPSVPSRERLLGVLS